MSRRVKSPRKTPVGYERINGRLRKSCSPGQERNTATGRCRKISAKKSPKAARKTPAGYERVNGILRKRCRPDQERNEVSGRCRKISVKKSPRKSRKARKARADLKSPAECPVCFENTTTGVQPCGHPLCGDCFTNIRGAARRTRIATRCPLCRGGIQRIKNMYRKSGAVSPILPPRSPKRKSASPKRKSASPKRKSASPKRKSASPTECPVCYEQTTCKINTCGHPLCGQCGQGMVASGRTIRCPLCRANFNEIRC
jgi:Zinc finger, C3HC4 type (RING finger)